jgi:EAL domain-containing protein (putative c-di-GMP-specific phosphodiesterase class I)
MNARLNLPWDDRPYSLEYVQSLIVSKNNQAVGRYGQTSITSQYQPIFSLAHSRIVGHEALIRAFDNRGHAIPTHEVLGYPRNFNESLLLDRLSRTLHIQNFLNQGSNPHWLFLNVNPIVFVESLYLDMFFKLLLDSYGLAPHQLVLEVLEQNMPNETRLLEAVAEYRKLGCLIAIDDFGAGYSNFDRVWHIQPDIVKLDQTVIARASVDHNIRQLIPGMIELLHEAGSLVLIEGVETEDEAFIAMDSDADFVQGHYFGFPAEKLFDPESANTVFSKLWKNFKNLSQASTQQQRDEIAPYRNAIGFSASLVSSGMGLELASKNFLMLKGALRCYLLDEEGNQIGDNVSAPDCSANGDPRFKPLAETKGANWSRRYYFRRAMEHFGTVQTTRPYLSITGASQCITVSIAIGINGQTLILCGDIQPTQDSTRSS